MRWILALTLLAGSSFYLYDRYRRLNAPPSPPPPAVEPLPEPADLLSVAEIKRIRRSVDDPNPAVRMTTLELLFDVRDPEAVVLLNKAASSDYDTDVRLKSIALLKTAQDVPILKLQGLIKALTDFDPAVRVASLKAIGDVGDAAAAPWVADALKDSEPDVRAEALRTIGRFQDKRVAEQAALAAKLREQYEQAVQRAKDRQERDGN